jgi:hypothetical protein
MLLAAGTISKKPANSVPVTFIAIAATRNTSERYTRFVLVIITPVGERFW